MSWGSTAYTPIVTRNEPPFGFHERQTPPDYPTCNANPYIGTAFLKAQLNDEFAEIQADECGGTSPDFMDELKCTREEFASNSMSFFLTVAGTIVSYLASVSSASNLIRQDSTCYSILVLSIMIFLTVWVSNTITISFSTFAQCGRFDLKSAMRDGLKGAVPTALSAALIIAFFELIGKTSVFNDIKFAESIFLGTFVMVSTMLIANLTFGVKTQSCA